MLDLIPYRPLKRLVRAIRIRYYSVPWPEDVPSIVVEEEADHYELLLRNWFGFEGMYLSYHYEGQALNLRRPEGQTADGQQRELHVRARETDAGLEVVGHVEPSRYEHKRAHIEAEPGDGLRWLDEDELESALFQGPGEDPDHPHDRHDP